MAMETALADINVEGDAEDGMDLDSDAEPAGMRKLEKKEKAEKKEKKDKKKKRKSEVDGDAMEVDGEKKKKKKRKSES